MLTCIVPFLSDTALNRLVSDKIAQGKTDGLFSLYPFLSQQTLKMLAQYLMESGNIEEIKQAAAYL